MGAAAGRPQQANMSQTGSKASVLAAGSLRSPPSRGLDASVDSLTFARRLQLRGQPRFHTAFQFNPFWGTLRERRIILITSGRSIRLAARGTRGVLHDYR